MHNQPDLRRVVQWKNHLVLPLLYVSFHRHTDVLHMCWDCFDSLHYWSDFSSKYMRKIRLAYLHRGTYYEILGFKQHILCMCWIFNQNKKTLSLFITYIFAYIPLCTSYIYTLNYSKKIKCESLCENIFKLSIETAQRARCFNLV